MLIHHVLMEKKKNYFYCQFIWFNLFLVLKNSFINYEKIILPGVPVLGASNGSNESISKLTCNDLSQFGSILPSAMCATS